ncbi:hypothetical protein [Phenylobacterium sp. J367]|uniref:hypothetical protein n=1 Tax=Phenylobacterium sp. J367 TaxID=2898435 RepID=UPI002151C287|nr:hypothetical protein [Phenylobacterium sp. J367]MCR5877737.1 hypothetical protein [Phenylobacterium sp. J367]
MDPAPAPPARPRPRWLKPLGFAAVIALHVAALLLVGLLMLLTNPLTDQRLPWAPFFHAWPFLAIVSLAALIWQHRERGVWLLAVAVGLAPFVATLGLALAGPGQDGPKPQRSRLDPARLDWRVVRGDPASIEIFNGDGHWSLSCASGADLILTGPISPYRPEPVVLVLGEARIPMERRIEAGPLAHAARRLDGEVLAALTPSVPSRILLDGASIELRPLPPAVAAPFAEACAAVHRQWIADGGWCAQAQRLTADLPPSSPNATGSPGNGAAEGAPRFPAAARPRPSPDATAQRREGPPTAEGAPLRRLGPSRAGDQPASEKRQTSAGCEAGPKPRDHRGRQLEWPPDIALPATRQPHPEEVERRPGERQAKPDQPIAQGPPHLLCAGLGSRLSLFQPSGSPAVDPRPPSCLPGAGTQGSRRDRASGGAPAPSLTCRGRQARIEGGIGGSRMFTDAPPTAPAAEIQSMSPEQLADLDCLTVFMAAEGADASATEARRRGRVYADRLAKSDPSRDWRKLAASPAGITYGAFMRGQQNCPRRRSGRLSPNPGGKRLSPRRATGRYTSASS